MRIIEMVQCCLACLGLCCATAAYADIVVIVSANAPVADLNPARASWAAEALRSEGGDAVGMACDVTEPLAVALLCEEVAELGGFQVLAQVAGLSPSMGDFRTIIGVNLLGATAVADGLRPFAPVGGAAILIASLAAHGFSPTDAVEALLRNPDDRALADKLARELGDAQATPQMAYTLSKHGLITYCRRQAPAWGERGARIVSLSPGLIATPQGAREFEKSASKFRLYEQTPLRREGTMLEIADAIEFLASDKASFISGTDLLIDGGLYAALSTGS